jgi:hypothetical protein
MTENKIEVANSDIGGNFTGRDSLNFNNIFRESEYLSDLYVKYQTEAETNPGLKAICEELNYYTSQADGDVKGLETKLTEGNRSNIIWYAKRVKERFHKKLILNSQFSVISQDIHVFILASVCSHYMLEVYEKVCEETDPTVINVLINERIIKPIEAELGRNLFKYTKEDILGMLYFLTGNCHIKWCK